MKLKVSRVDVWTAAIEDRSGGAAEKLEPLALFALLVSLPAGVLAQAFQPSQPVDIVARVFEMLKDAGLNVYR